MRLKKSMKLKKSCIRSFKIIIEWYTTLQKKKTPSKKPTRHSRAFVGMADPETLALTEAAAMAAAAAAAAASAVPGPPLVENFSVDPLAEPGGVVASPPEPPVFEDDEDGVPVTRAEFLALARDVRDVKAMIRELLDGMKKPPKEKPTPRRPACVRCSENHLACSKGQPCTRCVGAGVGADCKYKKKTKRRGVDASAGADVSKRARVTE